MKLLILGHSYAYEMENLTRVFFPGEKLEVLWEGDIQGSDTIATCSRDNADGSVDLYVRYSAEGFAGDRTAWLAPGMAEEDAEHAMGRMLYAVLSECVGIAPVWGILTGVRPVRLARTLIGRSGEENARKAFLNRYLVSRDRMDLAFGIAGRQEALLTRVVENGFSLYIGIPFCPTRCLYCSFVSHDIEGAAKLVPEYVEKLCEEIRCTGRIAERLGLTLQTVYVGGGTPTSLEPAQLRAILSAVEESFNLSGLLEYTVEAGRPDTLTPEKLSVLREMGVDRVSVNPQTMNDDILRRIGRGHTAAQVREAFAMARDTGFGCVNMDLIAGLPGDSPESFACTLDQVLEMAPENVTVHTLTVKRSSRLRESEDAWIGGVVDTEGLLECAGIRLGDGGYAPYYLYRQKASVSGLENTGWAKPGSEGLYNILIMEELQTILAVGASAVTKLRSRDGELRRVFNFKFPYEYLSRFDEILTRKSAVEKGEWL